MCWPGLRSIAGKMSSPARNDLGIGIDGLHSNLCIVSISEKVGCFTHLFQNFCYKTMYDSKHRANKLTIEPYKSKFIQKGYRENLLCEDCEKIINKYETYFANVWYEQQKLPKKIVNDRIVLTDLDYTKFKLFHLSVLWRASGSKRDKVNL